MSKMKSRRRARSGNTRRRRAQAGARNCADPTAAKEQRQVRGVKLKTVSIWTMVFALAYLAAFVAGRPPISAAGASVGVDTEQNIVPRGRARSSHRPAVISHRHDAACEGRAFKER
jgi:hypothetical protein